MCACVYTDLSSDYVILYLIIICIVVCEQIRAINYIMVLGIGSHTILVKLEILLLLATQEQILRKWSIIKLALVIYHKPDVYMY